MNNRSYVTIFPELTSVHLQKDVGMLPYSMKKFFSYQTKIVCYENDSSISESDIKKYNIVFIPKVKGDIYDFAKYLFQHANEIDFLNLYHITSRRNLFWILIYHFINKKGKVHLKLDADYRILSDFEMYPNKFKQKIKNYLIRKYTALFTVESEMIKKKLSQQWKMDIKLLPNGFYDDTGLKNISVGACDKENIFLTVGRIGTYQKATEILLEAFALIADNLEYKLLLIGPIENGFEKYIDDYYYKYPKLKEKVIFTGNISDKHILNEYYKKSKFFVLPSRYESFGLVLIEALRFGAYFILSNQIPVVNELTNDGRFGTTFKVDDIHQLALKMKEAIAIKFSDEQISQEIDWAYDNFSWDKISSILDGYLRDLK